MDGDKIENLYRCYGILADADKEFISQYEPVYREILNAAKGSVQERKLASQFIVKFFSEFPKLTSEAINAQFDLCEDDDVIIRKQAIRELPSFCRVCTDYTRRVSDILAQLLQASEQSELSIVRNALLTLFKIDPRATLLGIFNQIKNGEDRVREKCIDFIFKNMRDLPTNIFNNEIQDIFIEEIKNVLQDASSEEIPIFFDLLLWTKLGKTTLGKKDILEMFVQQLRNETCLSNNDDDYIIDRFLAFIKAAKRLLSTEISSDRIICYWCDEIMPRFTSISGCDEGSGNALEVLKLLAETASFLQNISNCSEQISIVIKLLIEFLPLPEENEAGIPHQKLQFSYVECLLYILHSLLKQNPDYFSKCESSKLKDFRLRLQYFARASQVYVKTLEELIKKNKKESIDDPDIKIKLMALKTISNINILLKDFFHNPPAYKSAIKLSWMSVDNPITPEKRKFSETNQTSRVLKHPRPNKSYQQQLYQPPSGKYSSKLFDAKRGGRPDWFQ